MLIAKYIADLSKKKKNIMFCAPGTSIIDYLLDISPVEPLPTHYYCFDCQYTEPVNDNVDEFDLVSKVCPYCEKEMIRSGHNCSEDICWSTDSASKGRTFRITVPVLLELQAYLDHWLSKYSSDRESFFAIDLLLSESHNQLIELQEMTSKSLIDISIDNLDIGIEAVKCFLKESKYDFKKRVDSSNSFNQLLRFMGLEYMHTESKILI